MDSTRVITPARHSRTRPTPTTTSTTHRATTPNTARSTGNLRLTTTTTTLQGHSTRMSSPTIRARTATLEESKLYFYYLVNNSSSKGRPRTRYRHNNAINMRRNLEGRMSMSVNSICRARSGTRGDRWLWRNRRASIL